MVEGKTIYLADDDADDRLLFTEAIRTIDPNIEIVETENGQELLAILQSQTLLGKPNRLRHQHA
jgi:CheY-like chemotaxis protein